MITIKATSDHAKRISEIEREYIECPWTQTQIDEALGSENYDYFVAVDETNEGEVVGYIGIEYCLDEGNICNIAVKDEYRRRGIATALLNQTETYAKTKGIATLYLEVNEFNEGAIKAYEKFGFTTYNIRKNYYKGASAVCMSKKI